MSYTINRHNEIVPCKIIRESDNGVTYLVEYGSCNAFRVKSEVWETEDDAMAAMTQSNMHPIFSQLLAPFGIK